MNILNSIHLYPPQHLCGAEFMIHAVNKELKKTNDVRVLLHQANQYRITKHYVYDGIDVFPPDQILTDKLIDWSHALFTHLDYTRWTIGMGAMFRKPVFHLIHNTHRYEEILQAEKPQYIVYNSEWAKGLLNYEHESFTLYPPCDWRHYDCVENPINNEYITLINLNENKGGKLLYEIAALLPHKKFLAVRGSYDEQIIKQMPNVTILEKQIDIREVYKKTRILIMPSVYESWGRTATEAMCSGIPVIMSGTGGLWENCGAAGHAVELTAEAFAMAIEKYDNEKIYLRQSKRSRIRSRELDPVIQLAQFAEWVKNKTHEFTYK